MKKMFFLAATAALALSSCSSDDLVQGEQPVVEDGAVAFSAYVGRDTRAAASGTPVTSVNELAAQGGFGVYAYDQGAKSYTTYSSNSSYPNFMYNQQVTMGDFSTYTYKLASSITKAEYNALNPAYRSTYYADVVSESSAVQPGFNNLTFDALNALPADIKAHSSLTDATSTAIATADWQYDPVKYFNNNEGAKHSFFAYAPYQKAVKSIFTLGNAPQIRYSATSENYDLLWADAIMNIEKPGVTHKLDFNFQHALSKVDIFVAPFVDDVHPAHTAGSGLIEDNGKTEIKVRSIKFVGTVASQALLNLQDGSWTFEATEESAYEINDEITLGESYNTNDHYYNVTTDKMVIPTLPGKPIKIQIVYDVITTDTENSVNSSTVTNTITSEESFNLVKGSAYKFYLDLGMTSVQFKAEVAEWGTPTKTEVDLPNNSNWHPYPYVTVSGAPEELTSLHKVDVMPVSLTADDDYYEISTGILYNATSTSAKAAKTANWYVDGQDLYHVITEGARCSIVTPMAYTIDGAAYTYWDGDSWESATLAAKKFVYSLVPNSDGKILVSETEGGTQTWETPEANFYLFPLGGGKYNLYQWRTGD